MIRSLLLLALAATFSRSAQAQFRYTFKDTTTPYAPLTGATSLSGSTIWDDEDFIAPMPFTWQMDSSIAMSDFPLSLGIPGLVEDPQNFGDLNGFLFGDIDIADRGNFLGTASLSPIRYQTTGTAPKRIFKVELANAGFFDELNNYNTMNDSINLQVWIYETSNIVEFHYGPSRIIHPGDYFGFGGTGPFTGYLKDVDFNSGSAGDIYFLTGNPGAPGLDSLTLPLPGLPPAALNAWPASGKVYRYTPKWNPCQPPVSNFAAGTITGNSVQYTYSGSVTGLDSLVWTWGDGQRQKLTAAYSTPITHTYTSNGHYNVCATAYSSCGNNQHCDQVALSVGTIPGLDNVKVYPNPASHYLLIEGLQRGGTATLRSVVGQAVSSYTLTSGQQRLNLSDIPAGMYLLEVSDNNGATGTIRLVKE